MGPVKPQSLVNGVPMFARRINSSGSQVLYFKEIQWNPWTVPKHVEEPYPLGANFTIVTSKCLASSGGGLWGGGGGQVISAMKASCTPLRKVNTA